MSSTTTDPTTAPGRGVLESAFALLGALEQAGAAGVTRLAADCGLPKTTAHRLLEQLSTLGAVERSRGGYRIGARVFQLGHAWQPHRALRTAVREPMRRLAAATGVTVTINVLRSGEDMIVDWIPGRDGPPVPLRCGATWPWTTAAGKVLVAAARAEESGGPWQGRFGEPGFGGEQGMSGGMGRTGARGEPGFGGEQGTSGGTGRTGVRGERVFGGASGELGRQGALGGAGGTGARGEAGFGGDQGMSGSAGRTGARGEPGFGGASGELGRHEAAAIRHRGIALDREAVVPGVCCAAVPLYGAPSVPIAALCVVTDGAHDLDRLAEALLHAGRAASAALREGRVGA